MMLADKAAKFNFKLLNTNKSSKFYNYFYIKIIQYLNIKIIDIIL